MKYGIFAQVPSRPGPTIQSQLTEEGVDAAAMSSNFTSREERRRKEELDEARKVRTARTDATVRATPPPPR